MGKKGMEKEIRTRYVLDQHCHSPYVASRARRSLPSSFFNAPRVVSSPLLSASVCKCLSARSHARLFLSAVCTLQTAVLRARNLWKAEGREGNESSPRPRETEIHTYVDRDHARTHARIVIREAACCLDGGGGGGNRRAMTELTGTRHRNDSP